MLGYDRRLASLPASRGSPQYLIPLQMSTGANQNQSRRDLSATPLPEGRFSNIMQPMEVHFTPELEAKLTQSATEQGRNPDELVQEVVARYFDEESRFIQAVNRGEEALRRGEYLTHEQVGQRLERFLRP
jgi:predicted transcriptional regulator